MEGGGVLGIALIGYAYALEEAGIRFRSIGGTSAGAITACLLAAASAPAQRRAGHVLKMLSELDVFSFVDGGRDARAFVNDVVLNPNGFLLPKIIAVSRNIREISSVWGMNPGDVFQDWVQERLRERGIDFTSELDARMNEWPDDMMFAGAPVDMSELPAKLRMVASEITTTTKTIFPEMADLFYDAPEFQSPAVYVRASMSVPYFFEPLKIGSIPQGDEARARWEEKANYIGELPREAIFLDGGLMSNFPISLFHSKKTPRLPTFGATLGKSRTHPKSIAGPFDLGVAMLNTARQAADLDFIWRNPDYRKIVCAINLDEDGDGEDDVNWLNFKISDSDKIKLFRMGVVAARGFLDGDARRDKGPFDWVAYKENRALLAQLST